MTFAWYAHLRDLKSKPLPFAVYYMKSPLTMNYLYAGICMIGAVYFMFKPQ